uniref:lysoplasmalogenase n=1 Tax=Callorhinchus milii TaxID=7868 RepID=A0A4W3ILG8_CALMI|eukprot:gi/632977897/ref/XP_007905604.1/ PREDICTED: lysoplasmalogenase-like protein TMEM86A [Callorhinchus milii]
MSSVVLRVLKELCRLVPFLLSTCVYFIFGLQPSCPLWLQAFVKCVPLLFLCVYTLSHGVKAQAHGSALKLLAGLLSSAVGDVLRTTSGQLYCIDGEAMFGLAYLFYIWMFGLKPLNLLAASFLVAVGTLYLLFLSRCLWDEKPFQWLVYVYSILIGTMCWRASAGMFFTEYWSWVKLFASVGGLLFLVSDFTYAVDSFCFPVHSSGMIAAAYFAAQMFITVSVVNSADKALKNSKQK